MFRQQGSWRAKLKFIALEKRDIDSQLCIIFGANEPKQTEQFVYTTEAKSLITTIVAHVLQKNRLEYVVQGYNPITGSIAVCQRMVQDTELWTWTKSANRNLGDENGR